MEPQIANQMLGRYEILGPLGEGGMGVVYKARDTQLGRLVALKCLTMGALESPEARDRSLSEARAIAALNHPNIATIYEIGERDGAPVLVLEYLPGGTLRSRTGARPLSLREIVEFGLQIADGLAHAHGHGVVHGDVKTENAMFTEDGRLKITDFGLARLHDERTMTVDARIAGTLMYMAPECLHGRSADCLTDIFSLGVVLEEIARPQAMPEPFQNLVARATARDRSQRFQTVQELAAALRRLVSAPESRPCDTPTILVIEDDDGLRSTLETGLLSEGYRVLQAGNGREGIRRAVEEAPHLVLLDVTLPGLNGFDVCRELRHQGFKAPIIMVTGRVEEVDRVVGLEIGADDYLTKPFGRRELLARIRAHLRRTAARTAS
jgi:CheY-like chemotaxis protein/tRNA A-37 threonylcarbamoyl transferase component Bud32